MYHYLVRYRFQTSNKDYLIFNSWFRKFDLIRPEFGHDRAKLSLDSLLTIEAKLQESKTARRIARFEIALPWRLELDAKTKTLAEFQQDKYLKDIKITANDLIFVVEGIDYLGCEDS